MSRHAVKDRPDPEIMVAGPTRNALPRQVGILPVFGLAFEYTQVANGLAARAIGFSKDGQDDAQHLKLGNDKACEQSTYRPILRTQQHDVVLYVGRLRHEASGSLKGKHEI